VLDDGRAYSSRRLLEGQNLADIIGERAPVTAAEAVQLIRQLADALDYMHRAGLVHRDIKPSNVIVGEGDWLTLTDFGIARALEATRLTLPGMALGTPRYMAPEQVRGEDVSAATDIYALGVIAFELLYGHPPFESEGTALMYQIVHDDPPALAGANGRVPPEVVAVVRRALAKEPADRWESAGDFAQSLAGAVPSGANRTAMGGATDAMTQLSPAADQSTTVSPAFDQGAQGTAVSPAFGQGTAISPVTDQTMVSPPVVPPGYDATLQSPVPQATGSGPALTGDGVTAPPAQTGSTPTPPAEPPPATGGFGQPAQPRPEQRRKGFPWVIAAAAVAGLAVIAVIVLLLSGGGQGGIGPGLTSGGTGLTGGQSGTAAQLQIVSPSEGAGIISPVTVSVASASNFPIKAATLGDPNAYHFHYFMDIDPSTLPSGVPIPTGQSRIIHTSEPTVTFDQLDVGEHTVWVMLTKTDHIPLSPPIVAKSTFRVLRSIEDARGVNDTPAVFYSNVGNPGRWHVFVVDRPGAQARQLTSGNADNVRPSFSPDGSQIIFRSNREGGRWYLYLMNANGTSQRALTRPDGSQIEGDSPAWSPDGSKIAFNAFRDGGEQIHVFHVATGEVQQLTRLPNNNVSPTWSPDGSKIAFQSDRAGSPQVFIMDADGRNQTQLTTGAVNHHSPAWSPDGRTIAASVFEENTYKIYTISTTGQERKKVTDGGGDTGDQSPSWTPNAKHIIFTSTRQSSEHRLYVVEVATGAVQPATTGRAQDQAPRYPVR
jgi:Tol biopolymer transport system component